MRKLTLGTLSIFLYNLMVGIMTIAMFVPQSGCVSASRGTIQIDKSLVESPIPKITVVSVEKEENSTRLQTVKVYRFGEFDDSDLEVLSYSLEATIFSISDSKETSSDQEFFLYVVIRRYFVAASNE